VRKKNHWSFHSADYHEVSFPGKIIFQLNKDESSQLFQLRGQQIDVSLSLSTSAFLKLNADEDFQKNFNAAMMPTFNYTYLCFNEKPASVNRIKFFDDLNVRRAIARLTPVNEIIRLQYREFADQCRRMVTNVSTLKDEFDTLLKPVPYDEKIASDLLALSGWKDSDADGILDKEIDGKRIKFEADLNYLSSSAEWKEMAGLISEYLLKSGIKINPVGMDLKLFLEKAKAHDFDLILGSWGGTGLPEDYTQLWHTASWINHGSNYSGFGNAGTDSTIAAIKEAGTDSLRIALSRKLQRSIYDDQPCVFLYSSLRRNVLHKRFGNQMLFSERPGLLLNMLRLLSINQGITMNDVASP
jgi:peptide/nickel transport system substrate-binding protein